MEQEKESIYKKWVKVGIIIVLLLLIFIPTLIAMKYFAIGQIYDYYVDYIYSISGLNKYLIKSLIITLIVPFIFGINKSLSINQKNRQIGNATLVIIIIIYNLGLYQLTKNVNFAFSEGKILKYYALTPDGVKFHDGPGIEPIYGIRLKPVTPEIISKLKLLENTDIRPIDPSTTKFFNPITGEPQVWYYRDEDGNTEFYNKPAHHPATGEPLRIVTKKIISEWKKKEKIKKQEEQERKKAEIREKEKKEEELKNRQEELKTQQEELKPQQQQQQQEIKPQSQQSSPQIQSNKPSQIIIAKSLIAAATDGNQTPVRVSTNFPAGFNRLYYFAYYMGAIPYRTAFVFKWYKDGVFIREGQFTTPYASGNVYHYIDYDFQEGNYEVQLHTSEQQLDRTFFGVSVRTNISNTNTWEEQQRQLQERNYRQGRQGLENNRNNGTFI